MACRPQSNGTAERFLRAPVRQRVHSHPRNRNTAALHHDARTVAATRAGHPTIARILLALLLFSLPILAISIHVFGLVAERTTAVVVILPLAVALAVVITCAPSRIDAIIVRGLIVGMVACAVYDAFRLTAVYALGWMGDFIPTMGSWVTGDPDGTGNAMVGYVWRYLGDGGGLGVCFFIVAFALGMDRFGRPSRVVLAATGYAVFPVWAGLIGTVALAPRGQELLFHLTPSAVTITLIGHLIFGMVLGLGFVRLRGIWEPGTWPFPPLFHQLLQGSGPRFVRRTLVPALATATTM
jgi:hypothetical protein